MLRLIPGWKQLCEQSARRRATKVRRPRDRRARRPAFEELECRRVLAGGVIPAGVESFLQAKLQPIVANSLQGTSNLPLVGAGLNDPTFVDNQVAQLMDQIDTDSVTPGAITITPGTTTTFSINTPLHSTGFKGFQISGNGLSPFKLSTDPKVSPSTFIYAYVDIYYRLSFTVDALTGTTTFLDAPLSGLTPTVSNANPNIGLLGIPWDSSSPAPNSPISIVITAATPFIFKAGGTLSGIPTTITPHAYSVTFGGNLPSQSDFTYVYSTIDISMGNFSFGPSGTVAPTVTALLNGDAHINLDLSLAMTDPLKIYASTEMTADWTFTNINILSPPATAQFGTLPFINFTHVSVDLGRTLGAIGDALNGVQGVTDSPLMADFINILNTQIPIINESIADVAEAKGLVSSGFADAISALAFINSLHVTGQGNDGVVDLGSFQILDPRQPGPIQISQTTPSNAAPAVHSFLHDVFGVDLPNTDAQYGLHFNFLEDPVDYLFPAIAGQNVKLVTFAIPPLNLSFTFDDIFSLFGVFDIFSGYPGVSADGALNIHAEVSVGYDMTGVERGMESSAPDSTDQNYGFYIDTAHTGVSVSGSIVLSADTVAFSVSGGISASFVGVPNGTIDPFNPDYLRGGILLTEPSKLFLGYGSISASATLEPLDPAGPDITLGSGTIATFDVGPWSTSYQNVGSEHAIEIDKDGTKEDIFVLETHLDPSTHRPVFGSPDAYDLAVQVVRENTIDYYLIAEYEKLPNGTYQKTHSYSSVGLIYVTGDSTIPTTDPNDTDGVKVFIDDLDGSGGSITPVDAVIIGTNKDDTLKYFGAGEAIIVGMEGNDTIRSAPTFGTGAGSQLVAEFANGALPLTNDLNLSDELWEEINTATAGVAPSSTKNSITGSGGKDRVILSPGDSLTNFSTNSTVFTTPPPLPPPPPPAGGAGLGADVQSSESLATNSDLAANESYIEVVAGDVAGPAGAIIGGINHIVLKAAVGSPTSTGQLDLSVVSTSQGAALHALGSQLDFTAQGITEIEIGSYGGTLHIGDLSSLGVVPIVVNSLTGSAGTATTIDSIAAGVASNIQIGHDVSEQGEMSITGNGMLPFIEFFGMSIADSVLLNLYGGTVAMADLAGAGLATLRIDDSGRTIGSTTSAAVTLENDAANMWLTPDTNNASDIRLTSDAEPTVILSGVRTIDSLTLNLGGSAQKAAFFDASQVMGALNINGGGGASAVDNVTLADVGAQAVVTVDGGLSQTTLNFGHHLLANIKHDVTARDVQLHIDNIGATDARVMTVAPTMFTGWDAGSGLTPTLFISQWHGTLMVDAGGGDVYLLDGTPSAILDIVLNNKTDTRGRIYSDNWRVPITANDDWAIYLGQRILPNGTVTRTKHLGGLSNVLLTLDFGSSSATTTDVVFDGDLDASGAQYNIGGDGILDITNQTVSLEAKIAGFRGQDHLYVYMPGATVNANVQLTSPGTIYLDGQARLAGTNPTASDTITIADRYGQTQLTPLTQYNSLLHSFNDIYLLGSMPQDALTVNVPTNVLITAGVVTQYNLTGNSDAYATVTAPLVGSTLVSWLEGPRPDDNNSGAFFVVDNVDRDQWASYFAPGAGRGTPPNPFVDQPYGIDMPHSDGSIDVTYWQWVTINNVRTLVHTDYLGTGRFWTVNQNPVAVNNDVQLNASQVRGTFNFNVTGPDYDYIEQLERGMFSAAETSVDYNAPFYTWGHGYDNMRIAFGQSNITLTDVNPQLSVAINSENKNYTYPGETFTGFPDHDDKVLRSPYPVTTLNVGNGTLSRIQGNVSVSNMIVNVDDSAGTNANLILTSTTLGTWTTTGGTTHPVLSIGGLDSRTFTVIAGTVDKVDIESVPSTAGLTSVQTANNSTTPVDVYLMGRAQASAFQAVGNINLHIGDRLNADGTVTLAGQVSGTWPTNSTSVPINYQYTGTSGHGLLVYDAANTSAPLGEMAIGPVTGDTTKEKLLFNNSLTNVVYGSNTDVSYYEPVFGQSNVFNLIDHRLNGTIHYYANASGPFSRVNIQAAFGPVEVDGRGVNTDVEISPAAFSVLGLGNSPVGNDLLSTILAPVTVTHATLAIRSDTSSTPAPSQPKNVVIGTSQITGIAGAAIQYSNLADSSGVTGLLVQMPRFAANLSITGTPSGATTSVSVIGQSMLTTQITGTSGRLALGTFFDLSIPNFDFGQFSFTTQSLTIGNGSTQGIQGDILLGEAGKFSTTAGIVIDDRSDPTARTVNFNTSSSTVSGVPAISGLGSGNIAMQQIPGGLTVYSSAGSHWTMKGIESLGPATLYAGVGTVVDLAGPPGNFNNSAVIPRWTVYGAGTVRLNPGAVPKVSSAQFPIIKADPARPTDVTQLIVDHTNVQAVFFDDNSVPSGVNNFLQVLDKSSDGLGRISLGSATDLQTEVEYAPATTQLTLNGDHINASQFNILDTDALSTTINPSFNQVNVLATTAPLDITQPAQRFSGGVASVILGNSGSMQALHGDITLDGSNAALPTMPATLSFSADNADHVVTFANPSSGHIDIAGLAPAAIHVVGSHIAASLMGGSGNNKLVGADASNSWVVSAANGGTLNSIFTFSGFKNLTGGSGADTFRFATSGSLTGNLDGGSGVDTLTYDNPSTWHTLPFNLAQGIAPLVGGTASNLEIVPIDAASAINQTNYIGDVVSYSPLSIIGGLGTFRYSATGLPTGLSIDANTGVVTGTVPSQISGDHAVHVSATDGYNSTATDFTWTIQSFSLVNPGGIHSHVGDPVNLQIQAQGNTNGLTYSAVGLPDGLSIDPATGVISGTISLQAAQTETFDPTVSATDGQNTQSISFLWIIPSFALQNPGDQTIPEGVPVHLPLLAYNFSGYSLNYGYAGLPPGFYIAYGGILTGSFTFTGMPESYDITVTGSEGYVTDTVEFKLTTEPGFNISGVNDRADWDGTAVDTQISVSSPYGHQLSVAVSGLPDGLTIDDNLHITGTISRSAASNTPHHVTVNVTNATLGYTYDAGFDWTVRHIPTAAELNAGTPAGVPFLATVLDPTNYPAPYYFHGITYGSGATSHSIIYFSNNYALWALDGNQASPVNSIDPNHPTLPSYVGAFDYVDGRGVLFSDGATGDIWFADQSGARVIYAAGSGLQLTLLGDSATANNVDFVDAEQYDPASSNYSVSLLSVTFNNSGPPVITTIFNSTNNINTAELTAFADGLIFDAKSPSDDVETLYWYDPAAAQLHTLLSSSQIASLHHYTVRNNNDGTQTMFFVENAFGFAILDRLDSSQLTAANPNITQASAFNEVDHAMPLVDGSVLLMESKPGPSGNEVQLWYTDGATNTSAIGQPFVIDYDGSVSDPVVVGDDVYFFYTPENFNQVTDTTVTSQIWKFDPTTLSLTAVANLFGAEPLNYGITSVTVGGGKIYFTMDDSIGNFDLWSFDPANGVGQVAENPNNQCQNANSLAYINGALYFQATALGVVDIDGNATYQMWELGPAPPAATLPGDFNNDGSVDAADYVFWRMNDGTQAGYNTWRSNFGRTLASGSGEAVPSVVESASMPTSQPAAIAISIDNATETSDDALASESVAQEEGSALNTSQPAATMYSLDQYFSLLHPVDLLQASRSAMLSLSPTFNTDTAIRKPFLSDDLEQLPTEKYAFYVYTIDTKSAVNGDPEVDVQRHCRDKVFDALNSLPGVHLFD